MRVHPHVMNDAMISTIGAKIDTGAPLGGHPNGYG